MMEPCKSLSVGVTSVNTWHKMTKVKFKKLFGGEILERGYKYYKEGRVSHLLKNGNVFTATVYGSHKYKVSIDLNSDDLTCNCPYDMGNCKHLAAVFYAINNQKNIKSVDSTKKTLSAMSKKQLIEIITQMLALEPELSRVLLPKKKQILDDIQAIDVEDEETYTEFYDYIPDRVEEIIRAINKLGENNIAEKQELLIKLLKKILELNEKYEHGSTEDCIFFVFKEITKLQETISNVDARKLQERTKQILGNEYNDYLNMVNEQ